MLSLRGPKKLMWTLHARMKMRQYGLSEARVKRIIHSPRRVETGIAPKTIAFMQPGRELRNEKREMSWKQELWVMVHDTPKERRVISAWRYPGMTRPGQPLPAEIISEIRNVV